ncbi:MAG: efflux RND transporter periplasmic adaptor subunit [Ferruginibacter sp.]
MRTLKICLAVASLVFSIFSCKEKVKDDDDAKKQFCLTDTMRQKIGIDTVKNETVKNVISLSGKIEADEDKWVKVYPVVGGTVEQMKVQLGDYVTKGQTLAIIHSSEIADYQGQSSYADANLKVAYKNLQSTKEMYKSGLTTDKDVVSAQSDVDKAKADLERIHETTSVYGAKGKAMQVITAPVSGYIIEKNVTDNMQFRVDGSQPFFTIANLDDVWVIANVFESDIAKVKVGYDADIKVIAYADKVFTGKIDRIFSILDPQSRVMKVRIKIPNKDNLLKPEMFAQINIKYDDGTDKMQAIPASAVIFDKNKNYVMVYHDTCNIETREIEPGQTIGNTTYLSGGLKEGEKIITHYQLLIYNALND